MDNDSFYRPTGHVKDTNRTYVPNLYRQVAAEMQAEEYDVRNDYSENIIKIQSRPLVGVMYSRSAGVEGELFPVYIGRNSIGSDLSCDICLQERTVSCQHAILLARIQTDEDGEQYLHVVLSDNSSDHGTYVNGNSLMGERAACTNGDIITIGCNYVLQLSFFNILDKLTVSCDFERIQTKNEEEDNPMSERQSVFQNLTAQTISSLQNTNTNTENQDMATESVSDFYKPTKQQSSDHYNNKTIII